MTNAIRRVLFFASIAVFAQPLVSEARIGPQGEPTLNRKVRNLGMGNAGIAIEGTHESSAMYNPAGLVDIEKGRLEFFSHTAQASKSFVSFISDFRGLIDDINEDGATDADKVRSFNNFLGQLAGETRHFRYTLDLVNYTRKNFAAGLLFDNKLDFSARDPQGFPRFDFQNLGDLAMYVAGAHSFNEGLVDVGITARPTVRLAMDEADQTITIGDVLGKDANGDPLINDQLKRILPSEKFRFGLGVDLGLKSNLKFGKLPDLIPAFYKLRPSIGLTWQDMGTPSFSGAVSNEQSVNIGLALHPDIWILKNSVALDFRSLNRETPFLSKMHFGFESKFPKILSVRGGVNQGYLAAGLGVDLWVVQIDGAYYGQEIGQSQREGAQSRWAVKLSFNI